MDSNSRYQLQQQQQQQHQPNSGLLRFRSAPSSILSNLTQGGGGGSGNNSSSINNKSNTGTTTPWDGSSSSPPPEPDRLVLRFLNSNDDNDAASPSLREFQDKPSDNNNNSNKDSSTTTAPSLSLMNSHHHQQQQGYVPSRFMKHSSNSNAGSSMDCSFGLMGSVGMDLQRQSSFPASGHFSSNISFQNGYDSVKGVGSYDGMNGSDSVLSLSMNRVNNQISFTSSSPRGPSSLGILSKMGSEGGTNNNNNNNGFHYGSWNNNETLHLSEKLSGGSKRDRSSNDKLFSDAHNGELGLSHQLSFSKASSDVVFAMENMFQFPPDSVPCKIRAKRGCATHPRSIAERERRTRISERMRKLQELVPNMDKQTSTAEMLDLAVVYIKDLQKQFKKLNDKRAKCKCKSMQ